MLASVSSAGGTEQSRRWDSSPPGEWLPTVIGESPVVAVPPSAESLPQELAAASLPSSTGLNRVNLRASMADGATFGVMVGVGESYLAAFALAIGLGEISAGMVSSVPLLLGGFLQLVSLRAVAWLGSEKRWILFCAALQGLSFIPLVWAAAVGSIGLVPLLLVAALYWAGGLASGPPWNTWMTSVVPSRVRSSYFAKRTRVSQLCTLLGLVGGGVILQWSDSRGQALVGFAAIFLIAAAFRLWSVFWLAQHQTPGERAVRMNQRPTASGRPQQSLASSSRVIGSRVIGSRAIGSLRLLSYLVTMQLMVQISGPYFAPYMLKQLHYSYAQFVSILAVGFLSKIVALFFWGRFARRYGAQRLLWTGGVGLVPVAALWVVCDHIYQVAFVQLLSGIVWAAYELGFLLLFFEAIPQAQRTRLLTFYNLANMIALCSGAFLGAVVLNHFGGSAAAYGVLFVMSSAGRACALLLLLGISFRQVVRRRPISLCLRFLGVRPATADMTSPILSTIGHNPHD